MTASDLTEPHPTAKRPRRRGPLVMAGVIGATVIVAGAVAFASGRGADSPPRLVLTAGTGGSERISAAALDLSMPAGLVSYVIDGTLPTLPDHAPVWKLVGTPVDRDQVSEWAQLLRIDGQVQDQQIDGTQSWEVSDADRSLSVSTSSQGTWVSMSGGLGQSKMSRSSDGAGVSGSVTEPARPIALPNAAEAEAIARTLLDGMGVLDGEWTFTVNDGGAVGIATSCLSGTVCNDTPLADRLVLSRSVSAQRMVDGRAVDGLGWYVDIGDHGDVTGLNGQLGTVERVGDYPLNAPANALRQFESHGGNGVVPMGAAESALRSDSEVTAPAAPAIAAVDGARDLSVAPCLDQCPEPEPIVVHITDVSLTMQVWYGGDDGSTQYIVPMYRFAGHTDTSGEWPVTTLALAEGALAPAVGVTGDTTRDDIGTTGDSGIEPKPAPVPKPFPTDEQPVVKPDSGAPSP